MLLFVTGVKVGTLQCYIKTYSVSNSFLCAELSSRSLCIGLGHIVIRSGKIRFAEYANCRIEILICRVIRAVQV